MTSIIDAIRELFYKCTGVLKNLFFKLIVRIFMPKMAKRMKQAGQFHLGPPKPGQKKAEHMHVEDNGGDITIFCFSGAAVLYAGMPQFEFRMLFARDKDRFNLVFLRDLHRTMYHVKPDQEPGGHEFYAQEIREVMERLGARHNVAIGASGGGAAALYFASKCGMDQVVAFGPVFSLKAYTNVSTQAKVYLNLKKLICHPAEYAECTLLTLACSLFYRSFMRHIGRENYWDVMGTYRDLGDSRPRAKVFYGSGFPVDVNQAKLISEYPQATVEAVPTGRHNCASVLMKQKRLADEILDEIDAALAAREGSPAKEAGVAS